MTGIDCYDYERFRQSLLNRAHRQRLGIDLSQEEALDVLSDDAATRQEYAAWRERMGLAPVEPPPSSSRSRVLLRRIFRLPK
ncbi:hypothetical protein [Frigoribacterium sp. MCBA15_019]|uniref:hypothetical protein n=1 Tax=Frigoribacterium sp. MCBA15_019 TaxID=1898745 RepID=UPI00115FD4B3|nr:hypothetical protein [Frigoribacterium sp. MCBA15_019]